MQDTKIGRGNKELTGQIIRIKKDQLTKHLGKVVRGTVEKTLNPLFEAELLSQASRYELKMLAFLTRAYYRIFRLLFNVDHIRRKYYL